MKLIIIKFINLCFMFVIFLTQLYGQIGKVHYKGTTYTETELVSSLQDAVGLSGFAGLGFDASKARAIDFNLFDGRVTFKANKGYLLVSRTNGKLALDMGSILLDKKSNLLGVQFKYINDSPVFRTASELKSELVGHISGDDFQGFNMKTVSCFHFDIFSGEATFIDKNFQKLSTTVASGMTFDFMNANSQTGAKILRQGIPYVDIVWARANGVDVPLTDKFGNRIWWDNSKGQDVVLPTPARPDAQLFYQTSEGIKVIYEMGRSGILKERRTYVNFDLTSITVKNFVTQATALDWLTQVSAGELKANKDLLEQFRTQGLLSVKDQFIGSRGFQHSYMLFVDEGEKVGARSESRLPIFGEFLEMITTAGILTTTEQDVFIQTFTSSALSSLKSLSISHDSTGHALKFNGVNAADQNVFGIAYSDSAIGGTAAYVNWVMALGRDENNKVRTLFAHASNGEGEKLKELLNKNLEGYEAENKTALSAVGTVSVDFKAGKFIVSWSGTDTAGQVVNGRAHFP